MRRERRAAGTSRARFPSSVAIDPLGAEIYFWPTGIESDESNVVTRWVNSGTVGDALDLLPTGSDVIASADYATFDGLGTLQSVGNATQLALADGDDLDVILVCYPVASGQLMVAFGAGVPDAWRIAPRTGGGTQFVVIDGSSAFVRELGVNMSINTLYCVRGRLTGAASPSNDVATLRANDTTYDPGDANDVGAIAWTTQLEMGALSGTGFQGRIYAAIAKKGQFSSEELAELTARINALTGLGLTSV